MLQKRNESTTSKENEHRADMMVVGHRAVRIGAAVHMAVALVAGPIDLVVEVAVHMVVEQVVDHIDLVAGLGEEIEDMEKPSGRVVVAAVYCSLIDFEDRVMMLRRDLDLEVEGRAPEVVLVIQDAKVWEVQPVGWDMDWPPGLDTPGRRLGR
jgi:hypothetical protein